MRMMEGTRMQGNPSSHGLRVPHFSLWHRSPTVKARQIGNIARIANGDGKDKQKHKGFEHDLNCVLK